MEIVRQRRKRLLAWILTITLCVGLWQGSVYATEGSGEGTELDDTTVAVQYVDNLNDYRKISFSKDNIKLLTNENGVFLNLLPDTEEFKISAKSENYEHKLISWEISGSGANNGNTTAIVPAENYNWNNCDKLEIIWGKTVVVTIGNDEKIAYQEETNQRFATIELPTVSVEEIISGGKFFSEWVEGDSGVGTGSYSIDLYGSDGAQGDLLERRSIELLKRYGSMTVPCGGNFALTVTDENYTLSPDGEWTIAGDEYTYSGGISFYSAGKTYDFTMIPNEKIPE